MWRSSLETKVYCFDIAMATEHGVDSAIMYYNIAHWVDVNKANNTNLKDGKYWTYNSANAFTELFPFWSRQKIDRLLRKMEEQGLIISANYNKAGYDRTKWYTIAQKRTKHCSKVSNGKLKSEQPIPDINTDINTEKNIVPAEPALYKRVLDAMGSKYGNFSNYGHETVRAKNIVKRAQSLFPDMVEEFLSEILNRYWKEIQPTGSLKGQAFCPSALDTNWIWNQNYEAFRKAQTQNEIDPELDKILEGIFK